MLLLLSPQQPQGKSKNRDTIVHENYLSETLQEIRDGHVACMTSQFILRFIIM